MVIVSLASSHSKHATGLRISSSRSAFVVLSGGDPTMDDLAFSPVLRTVLSDRLAVFERRRLPLESRRRAVVTLTLVPDGDRQASIVLTRRARGLRRHSGQFALPGGRVDEGETEAEAGLRELEEEIGLRLSPDRILGWLDDFATHSGFVIAPVVLWADGGALEPDTREVDAIYHVPLADCGRPGALIKVPFSDYPRVPALSLKSVGTWVFSPTAAIIHQFAELAVHGRRTAVADFKQPAFARC